MHPDFFTFEDHANKTRKWWLRNDAHYTNLKRRYNKLCEQHGCRPHLDIPGFFEGYGDPEAAQFAGKAYTLNEISNTYVKQFKTHGRQYNLHIDLADDEPDAESKLEEVFDNVINDISKIADSPNDRLGLQLFFPGLVSFFAIT